VKIIGHKGAGVAAAENSASGLRHALQLGLDAVEIDIWPTADKQFVVFHDAHLGRITGHAGWTNAMTSDELRALLIRSNRSSGTAEKLLFLPEALELAAGRLEVILEVKRTRHDLERYAWVEERLWQILCKHAAQDWTTVISFDHRTLQTLRNIAAEARIGMLYAGEWLTLWDEVDALAPNALLPHWAQTTSALIERAHQSDLTVYPWAVDHRDWMERLIEMGVDGIISDYPHILLEILQRAPQSCSAQRGVGGTS